MTVVERQTQSETVDTTQETSPLHQHQHYHHHRRSPLHLRLPTCFLVRYIRNRLEAAVLLEIGHHDCRLEFLLDQLVRGYGQEDVSASG